MRISELARLAGIAPSAVRFYEEAGVLPAAPRRPNGYREYGDDALALLRLVVALRRLGVGPIDAGRLARLCVERGSVDADLAPLLVEQRAAITRQRSDLDRLEDEIDDLEATIALARRPTPDEDGAARIRVLFVCSGNSARSQIAEALLGQAAGSWFEVVSAGIEPRPVHPLTIRVLAERGIDWSGARSKSLDPYLGQPFDYVVTVCDRARQACPVFAGSENTLHWGLEDPAEVEGPAEEQLDAFRRTAAELATRLAPFIALARRARRPAAAASAR